MEARDIACVAREAALDRKGADVAVLDVRGVSPVTDYLVVVSGNTPSHLKAIANEISKALKTHGVLCYRRSGEPEDGWLALDYVDAVIHIFLPERREYYAIEELWEDVPRLP
jgi:ribosome-associated protein